MLRMFRAEFEGTFSPERLRGDFVAALAKRVRSGLFPRASQRRNRYAVVEESEKEMRFRSDGFLTSFNIGWNDVRVRVESAAGAPPRVRYEASFWGWAKYSVVLGAFLGVVLIACWLFFRPRVAEKSAAGEAIFWAMVVFWCFVWPWVLIAMHKRPAARALERLLAQMNEAGG